MPQVSRNNLIAYIPQTYQFLKGQAHDVTIILYQNQVGNQVEAYNAQSIEVKIFDKYLYPTPNFTFTKAANQITFGSTQAGTEGHIKVSLTQAQIDSIAEGAMYAEVKYVTSNNNIILPKLKIAEISAAGGVSSTGAVSGNVFTIPAPLYSVQSFLYASNDLPASGKIVLNSSNPASVTKAVFNNTDERGKRNAYLENFLTKRFSEGSSDITIALTDISDTSIYHLYSVTNWTRVDLGGDSSNIGIGDGIELTLTWESSAVSQNNTYPFTKSQRIGILLDAIGTGGTSGGGGGSNLTVSAGLTSFPNITNIDFVDGATIADGGNGTVEVTISGGGSPISVTDGNNTVNQISSLSFSDGFTISDIGSNIAQIEHIANFSGNQVSRLKDLVYEEGTATLNVSPASFEKNLTSGTDITFTYNSTLNDDTIQSATYDGNDVTLSPNGSQTYTSQKLTLSKAYNVTFLNSDGVTTRNDNNSKTSVAIDPQWSGSSLTSGGFNGSTYAQLNAALDKFVTSGTNRTITVPAGEYGILLSKKSGGGFTSTATNLPLASSAFTETQVTVQYEDGTSLTLNQYVFTFTAANSFTYAFA